MIPNRKPAFIAQACIDRERERVANLELRRARTCFERNEANGRAMKSSSESTLDGQNKANSRRSQLTLPAKRQPTYPADRAGVRPNWSQGQPVGTLAASLGKKRS